MKFLGEVNADVLCLQEVYDAPRDVPDELIFKERDADLSSRPKLFAELQALLPDHYGYFCPAARGWLHDGATTNYDVSYGIATFVHRRFPVTEQMSEFVFGSLRVGGWDPPPLPRVAHYLRLYDKKDDPVVVAHMHGLYDSRGKMDTPQRGGQAESFVNGIKYICAPKEERVVVCGDFNVLPGSYTLARIADLGLAEQVVGRGHTDTRTTYYKKVGPRYADYMFTSAKVDINRFGVLAAPEVSDHRALLVDI